MLGYIATIFAILASFFAILAGLYAVLHKTWSLWNAKTDDEALELIAKPPRRQVGQMARTIYWDAQNLSEKMGKRKKTIEKSLKRLRRQGRICEADGGWCVKES